MPAPPGRRLELRPCPACGAKALREHCAGSACPWLRCAACTSFGPAADLTCWVDQRPKT
jgi:hypothetical protein